jgi:hypothetical protein
MKALLAAVGHIAQVPAPSPSVATPASPSNRNSTTTNSSVDAIGAATVNVTAMELLNLTSVLNASAAGNASGDDIFEGEGR